MKRIAIAALAVVFMLAVCGCGGSIDSILKDYYESKMSDADSYSYSIKDKTDIKSGDGNYSAIVKYVKEEFDCDEDDITDLQEVEVEVKADYGYKESYTAYFIFGKIDGELKMLDKMDGYFSFYEYGGSPIGGGGGYDITFGSK